MRPTADTSDSCDKVDYAKRCRHKLRYTLFVCLSVCVFVMISTLSDIFIVCVDKGISQDASSIVRGEKRRVGNTGCKAE